MQRTYLLILFFLSGVSGLIYEIAWVRQASLTFGVSIYAYSAILAAYMAGVALGSYIIGRRIDHDQRPLRTYALIEVGIAVLAALSPFILTGMNGVYATLTAAFQPNLSLLTMLRLLLSIVILTPPTFLIGATLPVMSRIYAVQAGQVGRDTGRLYLVNTAGAVLGCLLAGVFLIRLLGLRETVFLAAVLNLLVAGSAFWLVQRQIEPTSPARSGPRPKIRPPVSPMTELSGGETRYVALGYALSGFITLSYEVAWARILSIHTLHAVYSFALMLTIFLAGLAVGSALAAWQLRRRQATLIQFGALQLGIGLLAILALFVFARLPSLPIEDVLGGYSVSREMLYELFLAFITLFPTTLLIGALFPVVSSLFTGEQTETVGGKIGLINTLNTLGAIIGSLCAGFLLIPWLGLRNTTLFLAVINLALGTGALWLVSRSQPQLTWTPLPVLSLAALATLALPPGLYLGFREGPSEHLVFYKEGVETTVAVFEVPEQNFKVSFVNGRNEVPTDENSMRAFRLLGHLPPLLRPEARNALVLSFGNGIATGSLDIHNIPLIEAVDLSPEMIEAAGIYWEENYNILRSARLRLHVEDGRNFLLQSDEQYDIITTDATHPSNASSWALFTLEFYQLIRQRLAADGVFMQWLPFHSLTEADYKAIIRTCRQIFPHTSLWYTGGSHTFLVVTPKPLTEETLAAIVAAAAENPFVQTDLGLSSTLPGYLVMTEEELGDYVGPGPLVTDNNAFFLPSDVETMKIMTDLQHR
jgi:spermidine synthase